MEKQEYLSDLWTHGTRDNFGGIGDITVEHPCNRTMSSRQESPKPSSPSSSRSSGPPPDLNMSFDDTSSQDMVDNAKDDGDMIKNPDGTPYELGQIGHYDHKNPDHELFDSYDQEMIDIAGADIDYYRVVVDSNVDPIYHEQRQKLFLQQPVRLQSVWEPATPAWGDIGVGWSSEESMMFSFNLPDFLEKVKEMPRIGSLILTCDEGVYWEIVNTQINVPESRKMWGKHRIIVQATKHQGTITDYSPSGQGRESAESGKKPINIM